jgi:hypothetical protein
MADLQRLDGPNLTAWMQLVLRSQVSGDNSESIAILAAHNEIVALQRKTAHADDTGVALEWGGEDPCWSAPAPGSRLAVVVTDDDEDSPFNYQAWIAADGAIGKPLSGCGPFGCYTLSGGKAWCADRLSGLLEEE